MKDSDVFSFFLSVPRVWSFPEIDPISGCNDTSCRFFLSLDVLLLLTANNKVSKVVVKLEKGNNHV